MKIILFLFILLSSLYCKALNVGMDLSYPPFEMSDANNHPKGLSVDFVKAFAKKYGYDEVVIKNISYDGLIPALRSRQINMIISSMTITPLRERVVSFSIPYARSNLAILVRKNSKVTKISDLSHATLALRRGALPHLWAAKHLKDAKLLLFDKEEMAVLEVLQGKADATIYDDLSVYELWQKNKNTLRPIFSHFEKSPGYWGVAFNKNDNDLRLQMNAFIKASYKNGFMQKLSQKYLGKAAAYLRKNAIGFFLL